MMKRNDLKWCSASLFCKLFLVSVLLQFSLGFNYFEDEYPEVAPAFYQYLEEGSWNILKKMPRGYMVPIPRVGRRHIHEDKRQNMIPQPRIGRELEVGNELAEILSDIQKYLQNVEFQLPTESLSSENTLREKTLPSFHGDGIAKYMKYMPEESEHSVVLRKDSTLARKEIDDISRVSDEDSSNRLQNSNPDLNTDFSLPPNKEDIILSRERKNSGFDIFEDDKRQGLVPLSSLDKAKILTALEDKKQIGGLIAYPRLGRQIWELHQTFIPYPRAGRVIIDPETLDYDILLNDDFGTTGLEDTLTDAFLINQPIVQKRRNVKLIPRIGRKKRSVPDEQNEQEEQTANENEPEIPKSDNSRSIWDSLEELDNDYFYKLDKKGMRSKNAFIPRIGKKRSDDSESYEDKRAAAFTPRIGRASLIPRIGRSDPRFRLKSRGAFIPRIGRRAALIPRIGRSTSQQNGNEEFE